MRTLQRKKSRPQSVTRNRILCPLRTTTAPALTRVEETKGRRPVLRPEHPVFDFELQLRLVHEPVRSRRAVFHRHEVAPQFNGLSVGLVVVNDAFKAKVLEAFQKFWKVVVRRERFGRVIYARKERVDG